MKLAWKTGDARVHNCYFSDRVIAHSNSLSDTVVIAPSVYTFKITFDKSWSIKT